MAVKQGNETPTQKIVKKKLATLSDYQKVFESESGKRVLFDMMNEHYMLRPSLDSSGDGLKMAFNEGQRNVVLRILVLLKTDMDKLQDQIKKADEHAKEAY